MQAVEENEDAEHNLIEEQRFDAKERENDGRRVTGSSSCECFIQNSINGGTSCTTCDSVESGHICNLQFTDSDIFIDKGKSEVDFFESM